MVATKERFTYAIGDVHGCSSLLRALLERIRTDRPGVPRRLVFLGDYIDRGPESAQVIALLRRLQDGLRGAVICLAGNHEDMLLRARRNRESFLQWLQNGGEPTLASYGVAHIDGLPPDDVEWIERLPTLYEDTHHYYVHAGLRPGAPIEPEDRKARLWTRGTFLTADYDFGKHVVHGHTPQPSKQPELRPYRTNLDTAAVYGGSLTAGVFAESRPGGPVDLIQVSQTT